MTRAAPLGAFWLFYLGGLGVFFPYYSLYLRENAGLSGTQVGLVLAALPLVGMVAQPFWGQIADRSGRRARVLSALAFAAAVLQWSLGFAAGFRGLLLLTAAFAFFHMAVIPMAVSVSLATLGSSAAFGRIRVWGTLGFLLLVVGFPRLLHGLQALGGDASHPDGPSEPGLALMFPLTALLAAAAGLVGLRIPRGGDESLRARRGDWRVLARHRPVVILLALALAAYLCLQGPMALFAVYIRAHGGSMETVGNLWILMLLFEIPLVWYSGASLQRLGPRGLLTLGILAGGLRWTLCGIANSQAVIYGAQLLHGVTIAGLIIGAPLYLELAVPEQLRSTAQGLLAMLGLGLGGIGSNAAAGWLFENVGVDAPYLIGGLGALLVGGLVPWLLPHPKKIVWSTCSTGGA